MRNKIKKVILAAVISTMVCAPAQGVWAVETDGAELFSDGSDITDSDVTEGDASGTEITDPEDATGSVSVFASALAKQTEEQTQEFMQKEEEAAQVREERRVEKAQKASEKAEQEKAAALEPIQQSVEETKKKAAEEAEAQRVAKRQELVIRITVRGKSLCIWRHKPDKRSRLFRICNVCVRELRVQPSTCGSRSVCASTKKDVSQIEPGDLVFYGHGYVDHVALYIGDGKIIHASGSATGIKISNYDYEQPAAIGTFME